MQIPQMRPNLPGERVRSAPLQPSWRARTGGRWGAQLSRLSACRRGGVCVGGGVRKALLAPLPPRAGGGARGRTGSRSPASPERPGDVSACAPRGVGYPPPGCRHACSAPLADEGGGGDAGLRGEPDVHALPACAPWERGRAAGALASPALSRELAAGGDGAVGAAARRRGARAARGAKRGRRGTPRRWQRTGGRASSRSRSRAHARSCACADSGALHEC